MRPTDVLEALGDYARARIQLEEAGFTRTANSPFSEFAEHLVANHYRVVPVGRRQRGYDVETRDGERIQVKALWYRGKRERRNLSSLGRLHDEPPPFDRLIVVRFEADLQRWSAFSLTVGRVREVALWRSSTNSYHLRFTSAAQDLSDPLELPPPNARYWEKLRSSRPEGASLVILPPS